MKCSGIVTLPLTVQHRQSYLAHQRPPIFFAPNSQLPPRNRRTSAGQLRLLLEPLEDRQLLSAASLTSSPTPDSALAVSLAAAQVAPFNVEAGSAGPAIVVSPADAASDTITFYRHGAAVASYLPAADTDVDRGIALRTALSEAALSIPCPVRRRWEWTAFFLPSQRGVGDKERGR